MLINHNWQSFGPFSFHPHQSACSVIKFGSKIPNTSNSMSIDSKTGTLHCFSEIRRKKAVRVKGERRLQAQLQSAVYWFQRGYCRGCSRDQQSVQNVTYFIMYNVDRREKCVVQLPNNFSHCMTSSSSVLNNAQLQVQ